MHALRLYSVLKTFFGKNNNKKTPSFEDAFKIIFFRTYNNREAFHSLRP